MKKGIRLLLWLLLLQLVVMAACSTETIEAPANQPQGPALVMFYTEG